MNKRENILRQMVNESAYSPSEILPSKYWEVLNKKNFNQLKEKGYKNFKRTIALNYFTWVVSPTDPQIIFLIKNLRFKDTITTFFHTLVSKKYTPMNIFSSWSYTFLTRLLWLYVSHLDKRKLLNSLEEPIVGNPPRVMFKNKLISQDLANSFLEYLSIFDSKIEIPKIKTIIELGPGYGRTAYVILKLKPNIRYILVDIPPALYVAQRYFSEIFPNMKIFKFRSFRKFSEISSEFESSQIIFLLPDQLKFIPDKYADLFINISSLHEMRQDQIKYFFEQIKRLTRRYLYLKEWIVSKIPHDDLTIREKDYPIPRDWKKIYRRKCKVQTHFFEALYEINRYG